MKTFLAVFGIFIFFSSFVVAGDKETAQDVLQSNLNAVFAVLEKKDLAKQAKQKMIEEIVTPMFDFQLMAKLSLGKKHWTGLTPEKKDRFTELFIKRLRQSYLNKLTAYTDEKIVYGSVVEVKNKVHIPTDLVSKGKKISMVYKFYASQSGWRIYDVEIQGVSIIRSYRSQFAEILKNGTFEDLIAKMEKPHNN
ncbi:MAG: ABC transporter substrate-binding protein [Desulfobacterales bacterium]|jgi:phospholipid transport system substrate-binding protein